MILPNQNPSVASVAHHYDELDPYYREIWGEHVHHGFWEGKESRTEAVEKLISLVAERALAGSGKKICDVGCGYGGTSRVLAEKYGAEVTGITVSKNQFEYAVAKTPTSPNPKYLLQDWFDADLPEATFDAVISIESTEHMHDKAAFFQRAHRLLKPGGRVVVCAWLSRELPRDCEVRYLLEPICREGRLPGMGDRSEYRRWIEAAGLKLIEDRDITQNVKKTWSACATGMVKCLATNSGARRLVFREPASNGIFAKTVLRLWASYQTGSMRYGIFTAEKS